MNVAGIVATRIAANTTANSLIGGRVYPGKVKQEAGYPAVCVNLITPNPTNTKTAGSDLDIALVQVDIYGSTYTSAANTASAVRMALDYYAGTVTLTGGGTVNVASISYTNEMDGFTENAELYRRIQEYYISIRR